MLLLHGPSRQSCTMSQIQHISILTLCACCASLPGCNVRALAVTSVDGQHCDRLPVKHTHNLEPLMLSLRGSVQSESLLC